MMQKKTAINYDFLEDIISIESYKEDGKTECSNRIAEELTSIGFKVNIHTDYGAPIIYASYNAKADKDILFYMHYDVKPAGEISAWNTSPFKLHYDAKKNKFYGRGTGDDKGQIYAAVMGIKQAILSGEPLNYNINLVVEGNEESGSPGLEAFVEKEMGSRLYDKVIVLDSHWLMDSPVIFLGCRGQLDATIAYDDERMSNNYHAGNFGGIYKGACRYLLGVMDKFLAEAENIIDNANVDGEVDKVDMYDGIHAINEADKADITNATKTYDIKNAVSMTYYSSGDAKRSLIPKVATARIDVRYVDVKVVEEILELLDNYSSIYGITYDIKQRADGFYNSADTQEISLIKDIIEKVTSLEVKVKDYCGAYLPLNKMQAINGIIYVIPLAQSDENNHAPNENIAVDNVLYGIEIINRILTYKL